jgi:hypothetical protein
MSPRFAQCIRAALIPIIILGIGVASSQAGISNVVFSIDATNSDGTAHYEAVLADGGYDPNGVFNWTLGSDVQLTDGGGDVIATLDSAYVQIKGDPFISMGFAVHAGSTDTTFTISSALVTFGPFTDPNAAASAGMTVTDETGNGGVLDGIFGDGNAFRALYNGASIFGSYIPGVTELGAFGSESTSDGSGGLIPLLGSIASMQSTYNFELTARDQGSSTSIYVIIPEPSALAMLGLATFVALRRR